MPAQLEEVVVDANGLHTQEFRPVARELLFDLVSRSDETGFEAGTLESRCTLQSCISLGRVELTKPSSNVDGAGVDRTRQPRINQACECIHPFCWSDAGLEQLFELR